HEVREVVEVDLDVLALADPPDGRDQTDGGVGLDHARSLSRRVHAARLSWCRVRHALSRRPRSSITRTATSPPRFRTVTSWRGNWFGMPPARWIAPPTASKYRFRMNTTS